MHCKTRGVMLAQSGARRASTQAGLLPESALLAAACATASRDPHLHLPRRPPPHTRRRCPLQHHGQQHADWMVKRQAWLAKIQGIGAEKWDLQRRAARMAAGGGGHEGNAVAASLLAGLLAGGLRL